MQYKASFDKSVRSTTISITLLFAAICCFISILHPGPSKYIVMGFLIVIYLFSYLYSPSGYATVTEGFVIRRPLGFNKILIAYHDIAGVAHLPDEELADLFRTFGVGGVFGIYGYFNCMKLGNFIMQATQSKNYVLIEKKDGKKIVVTPDDTSLAEDLKNRI